jgi:hypothetical protein
MLRFRLRTLLIGVAVVAVPCAWVGHSLRWINERRTLLQIGAAQADNPFQSEIKAPAGLGIFGERGI